MTKNILEKDETIMTIRDMEENIKKIQKSPKPNNTFD